MSARPSPLSTRFARSARSAACCCCQYNHQFAFDVITPQRTFGLFAATFADLEAWATTLGGLLGMTITIPTPEEAAQTPAGGAPANSDDAQGDGADLAAAPSPAVDNAADDVNNLAISEVRFPQSLLHRMHARRCRIEGPPDCRSLTQWLTLSPTLSLRLPLPATFPLSRILQGSIKEGFLTKQGGTFKVCTPQATCAHVLIHCR